MDTASLNYLLEALAGVTEQLKRIADRLEGVCQDSDVPPLRVAQCVDDVA